jgi:hypothetical protein
MDAIESGVFSKFTQPGPLRVFVSSRMQQLRDARAAIRVSMSMLSLRQREASHWS